MIVLISVGVWEVDFQVCFDIAKLYVKDGEDTIWAGKTEVLANIEMLFKTCIAFVVVLF
jgi:hypothetical protein